MKTSATLFLAALARFVAADGVTGKPNTFSIEETTYVCFADH